MRPAAMFAFLLPAQARLCFPSLFSPGPASGRKDFVFWSPSSPVVPCLENGFALHFPECVHTLLNESKQGFFSRLSLGKGATTVNTAFLPGLFRVWDRLRSHNALLQPLWRVGPRNTGFSPEAGPDLEKKDKHCLQQD